MPKFRGHRPRLQRKIPVFHSVAGLVEAGFDFGNTPLRFLVALEMTDGRGGLPTNNLGNHLKSLFFANVFRRTENGSTGGFVYLTSDRMSLFGAMVMFANKISLKPHDQADQEDGSSISLEMISGVGIKNALYFNGYTNSEQMSGPTGHND